MSAIPVDKMGTIDLGRQGENLARTIQIDVTSLLTKWPGATITLLVKRKGDADPYFAEATVEDGILNWPITSVETAVVGDGKIEIQAISGAVIEKSVTATIRVSASLSGTASDDLPAVRPSWVDEVLAAAGGNLYIVRATPTASDRTQEEIRAAAAAGKAVLMVYTNPNLYPVTSSAAVESHVLTYLGDTEIWNDGNIYPTFGVINGHYNANVYQWRIVVNADGSTTACGQVPKAGTYRKLTFTGAVDATFDGTSPVTVKIPSGVEAPGTAHQQLVSDASGKAVWVDRTHYAETNAVELLPATALTDTGEGTFILSTSPTHDLVIGTIATVTYNGTTYACEVAPYAEEDVILGAMVGNFAIAGGEGGNADAPFLALILSTSNAAEQGYGGVVVPTDGATSVTISITGTVFEYHKLDNAYLDLDYVPKSNPKTEASPVSLRLSPGGEATELNSDAAKKILKSSKIRVRNSDTSEEWICKPVKWMYEDQSVKVLFGDADLTGEYPFAIWAQINYTGASVGATGAGILTVDKYTEKQTFFLYIYQEENCVPLTMLPEFPVLRLGMMGYNDDNESVILSAHEDGILYMYSPGTGKVQTVGAVLTSPSGHKYKLSVSDDGALSTTLMS